MTTLILPISVTSEAIWSGGDNLNFYPPFTRCHIRTSVYYP